MKYINQVGRNDTVMNPCFIAKVFPTFQEYVLIEQSCQQVEYYQKIDMNQWLLIEYQGTGSILALTVSNMTISLADIDNKVTFE